MKKIIAFLLIGLICLGMSGCSGDSGDKAYSIAMDGTEIIVGETTVSTLIDAGFTLRQTSYTDDGEIAADSMLEKNTFYSGIYVDKGDTKYCSISIVTDDKEVPFSEAVIATVRINSELSHSTDSTTFDGVKLSDLTADTAQEHIEGAVKNEDNTSVSLSGSKYFVSIHFDNDRFNDLEMKRKYDVDYN